MKPPTARGHAAHALALVALLGAASCMVEGATESGASGRDDVPAAIEGDAGLLVFGIEQPSFREGESRFDLVLATRAGAPVEGASVRVRAIMPSMGHEPTWDARVAEVSPGRYSVTELVLDMPGAWEVRLRAESNAGTDDASFVVDVD